ncbi:MAG TPA: hypothetical protein VGR11_05085 [Solirubrobacteraceae bacterium]|nr:hypothetical protein [Solirubrobacteraceae bacterium]
MRHPDHSPHGGAPRAAATESRAGACAVSLIGGPADGRAVELSDPGDWVDVAGARYVLRPVYRPQETEPNGHVGIFLALYAHLWASHQARDRLRRQ